MGYAGANNCFGGYVCTAVNPCESGIYIKFKTFNI